MRTLKILLFSTLILFFYQCKDDTKVVSDKQIAYKPIPINTPFLEHFSESLNLNGFENCGYDGREYMKEISPRYIDKYKLFRLEMKQGLMNDFSRKSKNVKVFALGKKKVKNTDVLLYGISIDLDHLEVNEYRIVVFENDKVKQNLLFCGSVSGESENVMCRKLNISADKLKFSITDESENVPQFLGLKKVENFSLSEENEGSTQVVNRKIPLPVSIPYKSTYENVFFRDLETEELALLTKLGMPGSTDAKIASIGEFNIEGNLIAKIKGVQDGENTCTILSVWDLDEHIEDFMIQKFVPNEAGFAAKITDKFIIRRSVMIEVDQADTLVPEVVSADDFQIGSDGRITKMN